MELKYIGKLFNSTYRIDLHSHEVWEAVYYTEGTGNVQIGDEIIPFEVGDLFIIAPGVMHTDYSETGFRDYYCAFSDLEFSCGDYIKLHDTEDSAFLHILQQLYMEYHLKRKNWHNITDSLFQVLYQYIVSFSDKERQNSYVEIIAQKIISNISNPLFNLEDEISGTPFNNDYFRKLFRNEIGKTPLQFLIEKRISYAKQLLNEKETTKISVKEIAWKAGFNDYYYFSRIFKSCTGYSPVNWLKLNSHKK